MSLTENTAAYEKEAIRRALERTDSITEAARLLRISRQTLSYKIEKYRLN
ncbi:MAG: helix-turn-helix domain-containing protein [Clostridium sp.]